MMMESVLNCCYNHSSYFQSAKSVEAFCENIKQIEHDLKLQDNSKTEVCKADNAKKEKIVHRLLYPDSVVQMLGCRFKGREANSHRICS